MKTFLKRFFLFTIITILCVSLLFAFKYDSEFAYSSLKKDYAKASWIYKQIVHSNQPIDIAFIGTSHTINGVNDSLLNNKLTDRTVNLGLHGHGVNMHYKIIKDLIDCKQPKALIIEVRETESRIGHFAFPLVAQNQDLLEMPIIFNPTLFKDIRSALQARVDYLKTKFISGKPMPDEAIVQWQNATFGYVPLRNYPTAQEMEKARRDFLSKKKWFILGEKNKGIEYRFSYMYLDKIIQLANQHQIHVFFLYLPFFGGPPTPVETELYKKYGQLLIPPAKILNDPANWADITHLNTKGSEALSLWLTDFLQTQIKHLPDSQSAEMDKE